MSTPNPLQPQGALDGVAAPKSRVRITVLTILALHVVFIGGLLLQGCKEGTKAPGTADASSNTVSPLPSLTDTQYFSSYPGDSTAGPGAGSIPGTGATPAPAVPSYVPPAVGTPGYAGPDAGAPATAGAPGAGTGGGYATPPSPASAVGTAMTEHVIRKGDTIRDIAKKYGVTEKAILEANPNAKPRNLKIDDKLVIPAAVASATPAPAGTAAPAAADGEVYVVKPGDTLTKIARTFGVTVKQLRAANNIKGDRLLPKQKLVIPARPAGGATATKPAAPGTAAPTF